jgi:hypothetical protein
LSTDHFSSGEYVPDPESDATAVIEGFFRHLSAASRELSADLVAEIRRRHEELTRRRPRRSSTNPPATTCA